MDHVKSIPKWILMLAFALAAGILCQLYINASAFAANTLPGDNEVITINGTTDGQPINASILPQAYSGDGNIILFASQATNLPNAGGTATGLYTYNIKTGTVARVDMSTNGTLPNGSGFQGSGAPGRLLSETGRYVVFGSLATNLIDGETKPQMLFYKRDTQLGTTTMVGGSPRSLSDQWDQILAVNNDGRFVLISSRYVANDYPNNYKVALGEEVGGSYNWTSLESAGNTVNHPGAGKISCDGAFAVIQGNSQINLLDLRKGNPLILDTGAYTSASPVISCNGRYVLYATKNRTQITPTPAGMNTYLHLVRYDRITGERIYIDSDSSGAFSTAQYTYSPLYYDPQGNIFGASIADTGDVVFNYKSGSNTYTYLKHLSDGSGTLESIAKTSSGMYVNVNNGTITSDGRYIFFRADPYNLGIGSSSAGLQIIRTKTNL